MAPKVEASSGHKARRHESTNANLSGVLLGLRVLKAFPYAYQDHNSDEALFIGTVVDFQSCDASKIGKRKRGRQPLARGLYRVQFDDGDVDDMDPDEVFQCALLYHEQRGVHQGSKKRKRGKLVLGSTTGKKAGERGLQSLLSKENRPLSAEELTRLEKERTDFWTEYKEYNLKNKVPKPKSLTKRYRNYWWDTEAVEPDKPVPCPKRSTGHSDADTNTTKATDRSFVAGETTSADIEPTCNSTPSQEESESETSVHAKTANAQASPYPVDRRRTVYPSKEKTNPARILDATTKKDTSQPEEDIGSHSKLSIAAETESEIETRSRPKRARVTGRKESEQRKKIMENGSWEKDGESSVSCLVKEKPTRAPSKSMSTAQTLDVDISSILTRSGDTNTNHDSPKHERAAIGESIHTCHPNMPSVDKEVSQDFTKPNDSVMVDATPQPYLPTTQASESQKRTKSSTMRRHEAPKETKPSWETKKHVEKPLSLSKSTSSVIKDNSSQPSVSNSRKLDAPMPPATDSSSSTRFEGECDEEESLPTASKRSGRNLNKAKRHKSGIESSKLLDVIRKVDSLPKANESTHKVGIAKEQTYTSEKRRGGAFKPMESYREARNPGCAKKSTTRSAEEDSTDKSMPTSSPVKESHLSNEFISTPNEPSQVSKEWITPSWRAGRKSDKPMKRRVFDVEMAKSLPKTAHESSNSIAGSQTMDFDISSVLEEDDSTSQLAAESPSSPTAKKTASIDTNCREANKVQSVSGEETSSNHTLRALGSMTGGKCSIGKKRAEGSQSPGFEVSDDTAMSVDKAAGNERASMPKKIIADPAKQNAGDTSRNIDGAVQVNKSTPEQCVGGAGATNNKAGKSANLQHLPLKKSTTSSPDECNLNSKGNITAEGIEKEGSEKENTVPTLDESSPQNSRAMTGFTETHPKPKKLVEVIGLSASRGFDAARSRNLEVEQELLPPVDTTTLESRARSSYGTSAEEHHTIVAGEKNSADHGAESILTLGNSFTKTATTEVLDSESKTLSSKEDEAIPQGHCSEKIDTKCGECEERVNLNETAGSDTNECDDALQSTSTGSTKTGYNARESITKVPANESIVALSNSAVKEAAKSSPFTSTKPITETLFVDVQTHMGVEEKLETLVLKSASASSEERPKSKLAIESRQDSRPSIEGTGSLDKTSTEPPQRCRKEAATHPPGRHLNSQISSSAKSSNLAIGTANPKGSEQRENHNSSLKSHIHATLHKQQKQSLPQDVETTKTGSELATAQASEADKAPPVNNIVLVIPQKMEFPKGYDTDTFSERAADRPKCSNDDETISEFVKGYEIEKDKKREHALPTSKRRGQRKSSKVKTTDNIESSKGTTGRKKPGAMEAVPKQSAKEHASRLAAPPPVAYGRPHPNVVEGNKYSRRRLFLLGAHRSDISPVNGDKCGCDSILLYKPHEAMVERKHDLAFCKYKCTGRNGGRAIYDSMQNKKPIRIFRKISADGCMFRYDGLYAVSALLDEHGMQRTQFPSSLDMIFEFQLQRCPVSEQCPASERNHLAIEKLWKEVQMASISQNGNLHTGGRISAY